MRLAILFLLLLPLTAALVSVPGARAAPGPVVQQIASDGFTNPQSQHATQVEPDSFAYGNTIVTAFQSGRYVSLGGASGIGFATSLDGGVTWSQGTLPRLTVDSSPPGTRTRVTDPSVAYDAAHGTWLVSSLGLSEPCGTDCQTSLLVSRSADGLTWSDPVTIAAPIGSFAHDKNWTVCDNGTASPRRGTCYTSFSDFTNGRRIVTSRTTNGGVSWSSPVGSPDPGATGLGAQPVVRPDGRLVVVFLAGNSESAIGSISSADGGASFGTMTAIPGVGRYPNQFAPGPILPRSPLRGRSLPSVEVNADGVIYAAWDDCRFSSGCSANDIVLATSADGTSWSAPARIPIDAPGSGVDHVVPGLGVDVTSAGSGTRLALTYHTLPAACTPSSLSSCQLRVGFVSSLDGGSTWSAPLELSTTPMPLSWLPDTSQGRMVGDYVSTSFVPGGAAVAVFPLARAAVSGFDQAVHAARIQLVAPPAPPPAPSPSPSPEPAAGTIVPPPAPVDPTPARAGATLRRVIVDTVRVTPSRPLAGKPFTLRYRVRLAPPGASLASVRPRCSAVAGTTPLPGVARLRNGVATCTLRIPRRAAGRVLRARVGAVRGATAVVAVRSFRIG